MQEKFEKLFYTFKPEDGYKGCLTPQTFFRGSDDMPGAVMNCGYQVINEPILVKDAPHFHSDADEYLTIFGGQLPDVFISWDAEVHFYMGPTLATMEKIVITEPTVIKVPRGWWHCPLNFVRVDKPIFFQPVILGQHMDYVKCIEENGEKKRMLFSEGDPTEQKYTVAKWNIVNEDGVQSYTDKGAYDCLKAPTGDDCIRYPGTVTKPYSNAAVLKAAKPALSPDVSKCVLAMPREITGWGEWCPCPQTYLRGTIYMEDATYDVGYQLYANAADAEITHFHSSGEEYLYFMGPDPKNILDFDAEIEMLIGDDPEHLESKIFTSATVVRIPPNVWHAPIKFRKMKKPVLFQAAYLAGVWGVIYRGPDRPDDEVGKKPHARKETYEYMGNDTRNCIYNSKKRCNLCGKCFSKPEEYLSEEERQV
jgi:hypothetical protein